MEANKADFFREGGEEAMPESKRKFAFDVFPKTLSLSKGFLAHWLSVSQGGRNIYRQSLDSSAG